MFLSVAEPLRRRAIGEDQRPILTHVRRRDGWIAVAQAHERSSLLTAGHQPQHAPGPVDDREGQRHPAPALVGAGHRDVRVGDIEDRISRHQRCGVAVRAEAEMNEVEHGRRARHLLQRLGILLGRTIEVGCLDRHRMDVVGAQRRMIEQAFAQMREVSVRIGRRRHPLVHLNHMHVLPGELLVGQCAQHHPRRAAAAHRHDEAPARGNGRARVGGDDRRRLAGNAIIVRLDFDLHATDSGPGIPIGGRDGRNVGHACAEALGCFMPLSSWVSPRVRRIRSASPTAACRRNPPRRAS